MPTLAELMAGAAGPVSGPAVDLTARRGELALDLLAAGATRVQAVEASARRLVELRQALAGRPVEVTSPLDPPPAPAPDAFAILPGHLGTAAVQDTLARASAATDAGGRAWVAARTDRGEKGYRKGAGRWFGGVEVVARQGPWRVWLGTRPLAAPGPEPPLVRFVVAGTEFVAHTPPGVFSLGKVDRGTALLLETLPGLTRGAAHDAGCGWGAVAIALAGLGHRVSASDDDAHAVAATRANLAANGLAAQVDHADAMDHLPDARLDLVATNPPFHLGVREDAAATERILRGARRVLQPGGKLLLVALETLGYDRLITDVFGSTVLLARSSGFAVHLAIA